MKKTLISGIVLVVVGLILAAFGVGHDGLQGVYWDNGVRVDARTDKTQSLKGIQTIVVNSTDYYNVSIKRGDTAQLKVRASKSHPITTTFKNHELTVDGAANAKAIFGGTFTNTDPSVQITIPKSVRLKRVTNQGSSSLSVNDVVVDELKGVAGSGDISLTDVTLKKPLSIASDSYVDVTLDRVKAPSLSFTGSLDVTVRRSTFEDQASRIKTTYGDVTLSENQWQALTVTGQSGDLNFENERVKDGLTATLDSGDIDGQIAKNQRNLVTTSTQDGDISVYGHGQSSFGRPRHQNIHYRLKTNSGDITIQE
ncbi:DUF4097 family beta strand repeat-containing protein [uncultured Secundilactobacillus sp.]|uniref:DUF4097 family beta strand repeat-containing protein n=1 Tax=uncultured Secundilactobacillus sp. TaxID=2813935 RepID=UPI002587F2EE|nr:DUF4097 family beta strand repeat-containing protein [uncultured Secundilactobacillus sp.]